MQFNMNSVIYVACVLAPYFALYSAAHVERRGFGGYVSSQQEQQQRAAASARFTGGFGGMGLGGGFGGSSQFSQQSSSSYRSSTVMNSFSTIGSQIAQMQSMLAGSSMSQQVAYQQMSQLASSFQFALSQAPQCGSCFGMGGFSSSVSSVFQQFTQLMLSMQSSFGGAFSQICSPFSQLGNSFQSFFQSAASSGWSLNSIIPQTLPGLLNPIMPGFGAALSGFGYSHQEQYQQSSSSRSSFAGGLGGGFGGSSQFSQQSSSSYSSSTVMNSFSTIGSQIAQMQSMLASSSMSQQVAYQQMAQLASSFQFALTQAPQCGSCFGQGGFSSSVSSVFQQFTQLMSSMQSSFGPAFSQICSPFSRLGGSFQSFFQSASSSGLSLNSLVPQPLPRLLSPVIPGFGSALSGLGFK